jgi:hypothetical protein
LLPILPRPYNLEPSSNCQGNIIFFAFVTWSQNRHFQIPTPPPPPLFSMPPSPVPHPGPLHPRLHVAMPPPHSTCSLQRRHLCRINKLVKEVNEVDEGGGRCYGTEEQRNGAITACTRSGSSSAVPAAAKMWMSCRSWKALLPGAGG